MATTRLISVWQRSRDPHWAVGHRPEAELPQTMAALEQLQGDLPKSHEQAVSA
jgi:hypothetical protein